LGLAVSKKAIDIWDGQAIIPYYIIFLQESEVTA